MEICTNCFADKELKGFISSSKKIGDCLICGSNNIALIDIAELLDFFQELLDNFRLVAVGESLKSRIQGNWSFFSSLDIATKILHEVLPKLSTSISDPETQVDYNEDIIENFMHWERLKEELKWSKRFISNIGYLEELGWDGFFNTQFELKPTDDLFRARVHHQSGLKSYRPDEMKSPKPEFVDGGRANPSGIPYLYLSDNPDTVLYEVRASYLDELSIARFQLRKEFGSIKIVDFTENTPLFQPTKINTTIKASALIHNIVLISI